MNVQLMLYLFVVSVAYDPLDPNGNITIKWDIMSWTPDGYVVTQSALLLVLYLSVFVCKMDFMQWSYT